MIAVLNHACQPKDLFGETESKKKVPPFSTSCQPSPIKIFPCLGYPNSIFPHGQDPHKDLYTTITFVFHIR